MQDISTDILIKASEGDLKAFETVYERTSGFVFNVALRILNNRENAEEVTQEVFLILYHQLKDFRFESSFKTWVYRITANYAVNLAKKESGKLRNTVEYDETVSPAASKLDVSSLEVEEKKQMIETLLNAINPEQRACVVLRNIEGLSYEEIAQALQININTVRSRLKRAREKLLTLKKKVSYGHL